MNRLQKFAATLAAKGFRVFPILPNKKIPFGEGWQQIATTEPDQCVDWWANQYKDYNIGIATGDGLLVLDFDVSDGQQGLQSLELMDMQGLPTSLRVRTPSGGVHVYLKVPPDFPATVSIKRLKEFPGVDVRCNGGLVVGPGSTIDGNEYKVLEETDPLDDAPEWACEAVLAGTPRIREGLSAVPAIELDLPQSIEKARHYLIHSAPEAVQGAGGDQTTYEVAARCRDFGVSEPEAFDLMSVHWNEVGKASPPWDPKELETKIQNAYEYATGRPGGQTGVAEFGAVDIGAKVKQGVKELQANQLVIPDCSELPPREWLYGYKLSRKYTAFMGGAGGVGKSAQVIVAALAMAAGKKLLHDAPHHKLNVWYINLEDDMIEIQRRFAAALMHYKLDSSVLSNIRVSSGRDRRLNLLRLNNGSFMATPDAKALPAVMREAQVDVLIVDPFLRSHSVPENDNEAQDEVMRLYAQIAEEANAAVLLIHHLRKGGVAGDMDSLRGGSTQGGGARSIFTLTSMSAEEANQMDVDELQRRRYVRVDDAKNNMAPPMLTAEWLELESVALGNQTASYPEGDTVQVACVWAPPSVWEGVTDEHERFVLSRVEEGMGDGERYSVRPQDKDRWVGELVMEALGKSQIQAREIVKGWIKKGLLSVGEYKSPTQRKMRQGLFSTVEQDEEKSDE